jgi:3-keto-5-aminohexanoate cleavage enzyme
VDKLVITVTVDSSASYPRNPAMPPIEDVDAIAREYVRSIDAGATIMHHHGIHYVESEMQPDGRRLSQIDHDGWRRLTEAIRSQREAIIQFGIASARIEDKIKLCELGPDMMSYAFNAHDEYFQPDPDYPPVEAYAVHPRDELRTFCGAARERGVKVEVECFHTGAFWNLQHIRSFGLLDDPVWATLFFGWSGGAWTPPTADALLYSLNHLPAGVNWNTSVMNPKQQWKLLSLAIALGGHVRVGWEDNPYLPDGSLSSSNAELVDVVVGMARSLGREVATVEEAREITGLTVLHDRSSAETSGPLRSVTERPGMQTQCSADQAPATPGDVAAIELASSETRQPGEQP